MRKLFCVLIFVILIINGCVSTKKVKYEIDIPEIDQNGYNDPFFEEGWEYLRAGKVDMAYEKFKESNSKDYKLYNAYGYVYLSRNKLDNASRNFRESIKLESNNIQAEYGLAMIAEMKNNIEDAFHRYSSLLTKYPETAWIRTKYELIKSSETQKYIKKADDCQLSGDEECYIRSLERAAVFSPEITEIRLRIGDHFFNTEDYQNASKHYEYALENKPDDEVILNKLAEAYENSNDLESAVMIYKKLLNIKPGDISITNRINDLKIKFHEVDLPVKFKNIFFKEKINREELAALIGHYFGNYLFYKGQPVILTDIMGSFAQEQIILVCSSGIIPANPNHSFDRFKLISRADYANVVASLLKFLEEKSGVRLNFTPMSKEIEPVDISGLHRDYNNIMFLLRSGILKLENENNFNPTKEISPSEVLISLRKIMKAIEN